MLGMSCFRKFKRKNVKKPEVTPSKNQSSAPIPSFKSRKPSSLAIGRDPAAEVAYSFTALNTSKSDKQYSSKASRRHPTTADILPIQRSTTTSDALKENCDINDVHCRKTDQIADLPTMISPKLPQSAGFNGFHGASHVWSPPASPALPMATFGSKNRIAFFASSSAMNGRRGSGYKIGLIQEAATSLKKRSMAELGAGVYQNIQDVFYVNFLKWISSERLITLPHQGGRWDKVLTRAVYFAEQLNKFDAAIQGYALDSRAAAAIVYGHAQLLLEIGHCNSEALDKAFSVFYKFSLSFSSVLHRSELLAATPEICEQLCLLYTDLITLVVDVAIGFYKTVNGITTGSVSLDIFDTFSETIQTFRKRQNDVVALIWDYQIGNENSEENETLDIQTLNRWLAPQDRVLATLNRDHSTFVDQQAEFTCLWFQKHLFKFIQSDNTFLLVSSQSGGGKTTLAGSIVERLQRPVSQKQFDTIFCTLMPDIPTTASSLAVVKSILSQLLNLRVGNIAMYDALSRAYHQCKSSTDLGAYEEHLWQALTDILKQPLDGGNDLVVVVDGLDEVAESQSASIQASAGLNPSVLLEKLVSVIHQGHGVKLITFSSLAEMPSQARGVHHQVTREEIRDDIHAVALKALSHNHHFRSRAGHEQESLLGRIIQTANGSFLWAILACEILNSQKSGEAVTTILKALESSKPSVQDLILKLYNSLEIADNAKMILSWILAAERPLTIDEIHTLSTISIQVGSVADRGIDIYQTIRAIRPLLTLHERIVRFRHPIIHATLHELANRNKIAIPLKQSETEMLLKVLSYAKSTLRDKGEPFINNFDSSISERLFQQHHLLEYTVRYWILHLQQSPLCPKGSGEFKPSAELLKVIPDATMLSILEQIVWGSELPIPHAIDLHKVAGTVRRAVFTENHPTVLQTYLALATCYMTTSNTKDARTYFYRCTKISRTVLSDIHPLTLECANHVIRFTENMTLAVGTETTIHREEILQLLITAYERQYGSTSKLVIQTRNLLIELYTSLKQEDRVMEIYRQIQEASIPQFGQSQSRLQEMHGHLNLVLGKGKNGREITRYKQSLFHDEDDNDATETFDIASILVYLEKAEDYLSIKDFALAERTYVELWTEVCYRCRNVKSVEWHEKNLEIATKYASFLKSQKRTAEASVILTSVWQQYERHQLTMSESIVSQLTGVAKELKMLGTYTTALSIFKYASSFYKNVRQEESQASREVKSQISETSTEIVKQSLANSSTITETSSTVSESVVQDVFFSTMKTSKTVDSNTIAICKKLTSRYMEQRNWTAAISVIQATLQRTWSSFLSHSIQDVAMASTFTQDSIELVQCLAECYANSKQTDKVEDTYRRLFRALVATENVDKAVFDKAKTLLISFYDKHGYADNAISTFQEVLVAYRTRFGATHELTIQTLYELARRCQKHPRNHPYWIEYYLQIITSLNKDAEVCHKDAIDATVAVTTTYWQDRRYAEAIGMYRVLFNTFTRKAQINKLFSDARFIQDLYEQYYQCLEETKAGWDALYQVTKEYREACNTAFGAESTIATEAILSLAKVAQKSEEHAFQAIALYEEASKSSKITTTRTSVTEVNQALSSLYVRHSQSRSSSSFNSQTMERAVSMTQAQFLQSTSKYGYSHESSLTNLRDLAILQHRLKKTDVALKQLNATVAEIITKETSSIKMIESAASISAVFEACEITSAARSLVQELHRQICAKDARYASKWSFDLTKCGRSSLAFLASLQYSLQKDLSVTLAATLADLALEYIYFEQFRDTLVNSGNLTDVLLTAAPLRYFLRRNDQPEVAAIVEDQTVTRFIKNDLQDFSTLSKDSPQLFITGILDHLGNVQNKNFHRAVALASNENVLRLTRAKKFPEAYDVAGLAFLYASNQDGYNGPRSISTGFKLASLLVGRDGETCPDAGLRKKMLELSNRIVKKIFQICTDSNINFAHVQLYELSQLCILLGEQHDYTTLESLLTTLWNTRDAQRTWPSTVLLALGRRLICARYLAGSPVKAIRLCKDIAYNVRCAHGHNSPVTIESYDLLAQLYTSAAQKYQSESSPGKPSVPANEHFAQALGVHEDILRHLVREGGAGSEEGSEDDDEIDTRSVLLAREGVISVHGNGSHTPSNESESSEEDYVDLSALALRHLRRLQFANQRLGSWPKPYAEYEALNAAVFRVFGSDPRWKGVAGIERWSAKGFGAGKAETKEGEFNTVENWGLERSK